jgi:hypothetical protein
VYTAAASTTVKVTTAILVNTTGSDARVLLSHVASGGSVAATNRVLDATVPGSATITLDIGAYLDAAEFLSASQVTTGAVTLSLYGDVYA